MVLGGGVVKGGERLVAWRRSKVGGAGLPAISWVATKVRYRGSFQTAPVYSPRAG